jgi:hypothetical protein
LIATDHFQMLAQSSPHDILFGIPWSRRRLMQQERYDFAWPVVDPVKCPARRVPGRGVEDVPEGLLRAMQGEPVLVFQAIVLKQALDLKQLGADGIPAARAPVRGQWAPNLSLPSRARMSRRLTEELLKTMDKWRNEQEGKPLWAKAVLRLIERALKKENRYAFRFKRQLHTTVVHTSWCDT